MTDWQDLEFYVERRSNNVDLKFSDDETISLYLFVISGSKEQILAIYEHADRHLRDWFPALPSYVSFVQRLNNLADIFAPLIERIQYERLQELGNSCWLTDSFPKYLNIQLLYNQNTYCPLLKESLRPSFMVLG